MIAADKVKTTLYLSPELDTYFRRLAVDHRRPISEIWEFVGDHCKDNINFLENLKAKYTKEPEH